MKKIIIKMITMVIAFFAGIILTSYFYNKGNLDMTAHMSEATLPILYFEYGEEYVNPSYGYTGEIDASCLRSAMMPLNEERILKIALEKYNAEIQSVSYEVRSADMERLVQNGEVEDLAGTGQYMTGTVHIKDLLEDAKEYALIFHVELEEEQQARYFARIILADDELIQQCTGFAKDFHEATLNPGNTYPITQYLETDTSKSQSSLAHVDIHSKYKSVIWDGMPVTESQAPVIHYLEFGTDTVALNLDYCVEYEDENGEKETYKVTDYFRVRQANMRMYLLDYERRAEKIFTKDSVGASETVLNLGMQWEEIPHMSNEEGSVVNFVVSDELWSYDVAQNKLSKVFSFKNGNDKRGLHDDFEIKLINMEDSGSMDFVVLGYMNRGRHEGETGVAVMRYDSLTNTTEELLFVESNESAGIICETVGELLYISYDDKMYLSYEDDIYAVYLNTMTAEALTENLSSGEYLISAGGEMIAWQHGEDQYASGEITTMDMKTGIKQTYQAGAGEYLKALAFSGDDFVYGVCKEENVISDFAGNRVFPMHCVRIADSRGELIREFDYLAKNKYVVSATSNSNRINLDCITIHGDGSYTEALTEAITSNEVEHTESIALSEVKDSVKKLEKVFQFHTEAEGKRKDITPKQVIFEENRTISLAGDEVHSSFRSYGKGEITGVYRELRKAIITAYDDMGVVTDHAGTVVWERGGRKARSVLEAANGTEPVEAASSLEAVLRYLLEQEGIYVDVSSLLSQRKSAYEILKAHSGKHAENFTGCNLSSVLYYVSQGNPVLAMNAANSAELIVGYDPQNIYVLNPSTGQVTKIGQKDAAAKYETTGNVFFSFMK